MTVHQASDQEVLLADRAFQLDFSRHHLDTYFVLKPQLRLAQSGLQIELLHQVCL